VKYWLVPLLAVAVLLLAACDGPKISLTFENRTESLICYYQSETAESVTGSCTKIQPNETVTREVSCSGDEEIRVIITDGEDGEVHYRRKLTCPIWDGATITIGHDGSKFTVTDVFES
jgi:hypothetical protein